MARKKQQHEEAPVFALYTYMEYDCSASDNPPYEHVMSLPLFDLIYIIKRPFRWGCTKISQALFERGKNNQKKR